MQTRSWKISIRIMILLLVMAPLVGVSHITAAAQPTPGDAGGTLAIPGFGLPSGDVTIVSSAFGPIEPPLGDGATLAVERLTVAPGASLPEIDDAQILQIEQGSLSFQDDLGLEAEMDSGVSQFFAAGEATAIANNGDTPAIVVRTTVSGATREVGSAQPDQRASSSGGVAALAGLSRQDADAPTEVVVEYNGDQGFDPSELSLARGGSLVIENTTSRPCEFAIDDLSITATIDAGSIDPVEVSGPAGSHDFTCSLTAGGDPVATGTLHLVRVAPTPTPEPTEAATTPEATTPEASPIASPIASPSATPTSESASSGTLLQQEVTALPPADQVLFSAQVVLGPGAALPLTGEAGPVGLIASGGDLTVTREGHPPSKLRDGKSVVLPTGTIAELRNDGDAPLTLQIAGVGVGQSASGSAESTPTGSAGSDAETGTRPGESTPGASTDQPADMTGANKFFPTDDEMQHLGLISSGGAPQEQTNPNQNGFWFQTPDEAGTLLPTWNWQSALLQTYSSESQATDYGEVTIFAINVDTFDDDQGAADFVDYIFNDMFGGNADSSEIVTALPDVDAVYNGSVYNAEQKTDLGFMVIQSGNYVVTLYASGNDLDATALMEDVASLIFGARG